MLASLRDAFVVHSVRQRCHAANLAALLEAASYRIAQAHNKVRPAVSPQAGRQRQQ